MKKLLIFDLDGTLLDTLDDLENAVNFSLKKFGFPGRTREQIEKSVGNGFKFLVTTSLPASCDSETVNTVLEESRRYYMEHYHDKTSPYDGIMSLLQKLKQEGHSLAIVSNKPDPMVIFLRERFFNDLIFYARGEISGVNRKPDPDSIYRAMEHFSCNQDDAVYIGDSEVDILTAKNAGIPCISVTWGFRRKKDLCQAGAEYLCDCPEELYDCIRKL